MENFVTLSIETHLFFSRIMKEHALFLEAGFPCKEEEWIRRADWFREQFEELLREVLCVADGRVNENILRSEELATEFTVPAEKRTERLSGIPIDSHLTEQARKLCPGREMRENRETFRLVWRLNERAIRLLDGLIEFKERILQEVDACRLFTTNYPLLIQHILREARLYRATIEGFMQNRRPTYRGILETEQFWNRIMMEHALFIRGLLDPTEEALIETADDFAGDYRELLEFAKRQDGIAAGDLTRRSLEETLKYREFKQAGTEGILGCSIASIILPLLADHVLREANHYIRLLESGRERRVR